jgi:hypothetical protein
MEVIHGVDAVGCFEPPQRAETITCRPRMASPAEGECNEILA